MKRLICTVLVLLLISRTTTSFAAPKPDLWPRWTAHDADSSEIIDHSAWNAWLGRFVVIGADGINRVAYSRVSAGDRKALQAYIQSLAALDISTYNRAEQFAYWVNLYNALTIDVVLEHYPVQSIREIKSGFFKSGTRASVVGTALRHIGFDNVSILKGGYMALNKYLDPKTANAPVQPVKKTPI